MDSGLLAEPVVGPATSGRTRWLGPGMTGSQHSPRFRGDERMSLMNLPLLAGPVRLAQLALENLSGRVARQRIDEID